MSFTELGYPAAFASEGDPISGEFDPYVHGVRDTMDVNDETGVFSLDVSCFRLSSIRLVANVYSTWPASLSWQLPL